MGFIFLILGIVGFVTESLWLQVPPLVCASIYIMVLGPGALTGGNEIDKPSLIAKLSEEWRNPDEIAEFIIKYWYSIKYAMSAQKRGANCSFISLSSLALGGWYFYAELPIWAVTWSVLNGLLLWPIGIKLNKALFVLKHDAGTHQWNIACISFVALSNIMNNKTYKILVNDLLPESRVENSILLHKK